MQATTQKNANRNKFITAVVAVAVLGTAVTALLVRRNTNDLADQRNSAFSMAESGQKQRAELLELYIRRVQLATDLLKAIGAPPLKPEWAKTETWRTDTEDQLAALDRDQNLISNHLAQSMTRIQLYADDKKTGPNTAMKDVVAKAQEFERFEQDIVKKRSDYTSLVATFESKFQETRSREKLKNDPDFSTEKFPLFPAELELRRTTKKE